MESDDETEGFSFVWTIQNFSYCLEQKGESLASPRFKINLSDADEWYLGLYPKGYDHHDTLKVFLFIKSDGPFPIKVDKYISIRVADGTFRKQKYECALTSFEEECGLDFAVFSTHALFEERDNYLKNDTLTLRCRIRKRYPAFPDSLLDLWSGQCHALTVIDVKRIAFKWSMPNFKGLLHFAERKTLDFHSVSSENQSFTVAIFFAGKIYNEKKVHVEIKQNEPYQKSFVTCKLSLLDIDGKIAHSVHDDHLFEASEETRAWNFTFLPVEKILGCEKLYREYDLLPFYFEFAVSSGVKYNEVESVKYGVIDEQVMTGCRKTIETSSQGSWKDNFQRFYKQGKFSDLTIRTASSKEFPVHKAILCAQSEVFSAMFEHDMKENRTGVIKIEDLDDDIVSQMLLFVYTDTVEDLQWEAATDLHIAADKYGMVALKRKCSTFLKDNMNCSNICEVLVIADMLQDLDLKSAAQDYVMDNATEIMNSENWMKFIKDKSNLAAEAMHLLCMRNSKIRYIP